MIQLQKYANKYSYLSQKDISFLGDFLDREETKETLQNIEARRKGIIKWVYGVNILFGIIAALIFGFFALSGNISIILESLETVLFVGLGVPAVINTLLLKGIVSSMKHDFSEKFVESISPAMHYSEKTRYFDTATLELTQKNLLYAFNGSKAEDSIEYRPVGMEHIKITGCEFYNTRKSGSGKNSSSKTVDSCYMLRIDFEDPRSQVKSKITLLPNKTRHGWGSGMKNLGKKVELEDVEFEKNFDVYCDDAIDARMILTPSCMQRIVNYISKVSSGRKYMIVFEGSSIFVKYDMLRSQKNMNNYSPFAMLGTLPVIGGIMRSILGNDTKFMEFNMFRSLETNFEGYIEYYLEIKNICELAKDLHLFYYDTTAFSTMNASDFDSEFDPYEEKSNFENRSHVLDPVPEVAGAASPLPLPGVAVATSL